jgi:hypothetical protein
MRVQRFKKYAIGAGGMFVLVMAILLATGWGSAVAAQITSVFVTNDAAHPVPVHEQGTANVSVGNSPTVTIGGTPSVQVVPTPFQQGVAAQTNGGEQCQDITIPSGKTLEITSFSADIISTPNRQPDVYLRTVVSDPNPVGFVRALRLVLHQAPGSDFAWSGNVQTTLWTGRANDPGGSSYTYQACISASDSQGSFGATFSGFVSGTLS